MVRGRFGVVFVFIVVLSSISVQAIPPHENFDEADEDLYAIVAFLADTRVLSEESLEYSLRVNYTVEFNETIAMEYSQKNLRFSLEKAQDLDDKLAYSSDILETIKGKAGSYYYLKDFLLSLKALGLNVSSFVTYHNRTLANLSEIVDFVASGNNETAALVTLADVRAGITSCRRSLRNLETNLDEVNESFSTTALRAMVPELYHMLDTYEYYLDSLLGFFPGIEPLLLLYVDKYAVYLGEDITAYGYFMAGRGFVANQPIRLWWEHTVINSTVTDAGGRYEFIISMSLDHLPGSYNLTASIRYSASDYYSNIVVITVHTIPTRVVLSTPKTHYYVNESIPFSGRLSDYKNQGIQGALSLHVAEFNLSFQSEEDGNFTYVFNNTLPFGSYAAFVSFSPERIYEASTSRVIHISIDTPTILTLYTAHSQRYVGDEITLSGWLTSGIDASPLADKTVEIFVNNKKIGVAPTNETGFYNFTYATENLNEGVYSIYSRFRSQDIEWRSASSKVIRISLVVSFAQKLSENLYVLAIFIAIVALFLLVFILRKRLRAFLEKESPSPRKAKPTSSIFSIFRPSRKPYLRRKGFMIDTSAEQRGDFREAIVSRYRLLLRYLSAKGMPFSPSNTHLDIKDKMIKQGLPEDVTDTVTRTFELARYSPYPINREDLTVFDKNVLTLVTKFGG